MQTLGLNEDIVYILNPNPDVTDAELLERAKLEFEPSIGGSAPFAFNWQFSGGLQRESVLIQPGQILATRRGIADMIVAELAQFGAVVVPDPNDEESVTASRRRGLRAAINFYRPLGQQKVRSMMRERGLQKDEADEYRHDYFPYHYNQARLEVLQETLDAIDKPEPPPVRHTSRSAKKDA